MNRILPIVLCIVAFGTSCVSSAYATLMERAQELTIREVKVNIVNVQSVNESLVRAHIHLEDGERYDAARVDDSIRALYRSGLFDFVKVSLVEPRDDTVDVLFSVYPKYRISEIVFEGNKHAPTKKLIKEIDITVGTPLDEASVKRNANALHDFYQKKGYYSAGVDYRFEKDEDRGLSKLVFVIDEGQKQRVTKISFSGNEHIKSGRLRDLMKTSTWHIFSWLTGSGYIKESILKSDIDKIKAYYKDRGYLDVEIRGTDIDITNPKPGRVQIAITVHEGKQYRAGQILIEGNTLYNNSQLMEEIKLQTGDILSSSVLDGDVERLRNYYGKFGYLETYAVADRKSNLEDDTIDVTYRIRESGKFYVESINIQGNTNTKNTVIVRELALAPGDVFDLVRMKNSEARLKNTRYFEEVNITPESTSIPNRKNLKITLKEGRTGSVSFGGGFSSVEKYQVFAEVAQTNFDITSYRTFFRGGGQKFRIRFSIGEKSSEFLVHFEEPWLFQHELAVGIEAYRQQTEYLSTLYKELRIGSEVYMRRWFFDAIEGRLAYRLEQVKLFDVSEKAPDAIKDEEGKRTVSKINLTFTYDTRDNLLVPTEGTRLQFINEIAGGPAGGPTKFVRSELRGGQWFPVSEVQDQVFAVFGRAGTISGFGGQDVPFFERYFLGGPDSLRGYDFREAGLKATNGEPIGGNSFGTASAEYSIRLVNPVRFVTFYDIGFVNARAGDFGPRNFFHDVGFGFRIFILGAPLRLDLGFPLKKDEFVGKGTQFHWSFGTTF